MLHINMYIHMMSTQKKVLWLYDRDVNVWSYNRSSEIIIFNVDVLGAVQDGRGKMVHIFHPLLPRKSFSWAEKK